jgi:hypothetical protein
MLTDPAALDLVARYCAGVGLVDDALAGASEDDLDRRETGTDDPDPWCARQVVHHLADSETNSYVRLRRLLAEPAPTAIQGYDEAHWAQVLHYDRPITASLAVFRAVRAASAELLDTLVDTDLDRAGTHSDSGPYTLRDWLEIYADHGEAHAAQIRAARGA